MNAVRVKLADWFLELYFWVYGNEAFDIEARRVSSLEVEP